MTINTIQYDAQYLMYAQKPMSIAGLK